MTKEQFDREYRSKGGIKQLYKMFDNLETLAFISLHFGVSRQRVAQWSLEIFGKAYDPRAKRREKRELGI